MKQGEFLTGLQTNLFLKKRETSKVCVALKPTGNNYTLINIKLRYAHVFQHPTEHQLEYSVSFSLTFFAYASKMNPQTGINFEN